MAYTKRNNIPRNWPVRKKGSKYVVTPKSKGIPLTIVFREILGICENRKEVKKAMNMKRIIVNGKEIRDERNCVDLFDKITILPMRINYQISLSKTGKYSAEKIDKKEISKKVSKIISKKKITGSKIQINLSDGKNFLSDMKCKIGDSVLIDLNKGKIEKTLPLKEKAKVIVFGGKHAGARGQILKIGDKNAKIKTKDQEISVLIKQLMIIE
jgi:small subunit ribosomal protein S4e